MDAWETHPLTPERFDDFADVVNPNRRPTHCWCVTHRLGQKDIGALAGRPAAADGAREAAMRALCARDVPPGVVTYDDGRPVGWCNIGPRADIPRLVTSRLMRPVDDVPVWSIVCLVVRGGHRKRGVARRVIEGAVDWARSNGAPAVEAYPVDPPGRMDTTMAFVGVRSMFEPVGFEVVGTTDAIASKLPRLVMRRTL